jgi:hypothetical protein
MIDYAAVVSYLPSSDDVALIRRVWMRADAFEQYSTLREPHGVTIRPRHWIAIILSQGSERWSVPTNRCVLRRAL